MFIKLVIRNAFRHRLRTALTMLGIVIAVLAFGLLQTVVDAWSAGVNAASSTRLVTRNAISLVFSLPITYEDQAGARREDGEPRELVRRHLHRQAQLLPAVCGRRK
jgi:hypothetical protein